MVGLAGGAVVRFYVLSVGQVEYKVKGVVLIFIAGEHSLKDHVSKKDKIIKFATL